MLFCRFWKNSCRRIQPTLYRSMINFYTSLHHILQRHDNLEDISNIQGEIKNIKNEFAATENDVLMKWLSQVIESP